MPSSPYDAAAPSFDRYRALPEGVPEAIRYAVLEVFDLMRPRLLDLGAGTGRIGRAFVAAGDDYVGVDVSLGMLREFSAYLTQRRYAPALVQADGERLPFRDATFDAVLHLRQPWTAESRVISVAKIGYVRRSEVDLCCWLISPR
jgi:ubiquinone/menaquinone biosynthesis C-methylase UbiE